MISADKFVDILEKRDLIPPAMVASLRKQILDSRATVPASKVARALVDAGHLTTVLAKRLLETAEEEAAKDAELASVLDEDPSVKVREDLPETVVYSESERQEDLAAEEQREDEQNFGLVPLDGPKKGDVGLIPLGRPAGGKPGQEGPSLGKPKHDKPAQEKKPAPQKPSEQETQPLPQTPARLPAGSLVEEELPGAPRPAMGPLDSLLMSDSTLKMAVGGGTEVLAPVKKKKGLFAFFSRKRKRKKPEKKENVWDSPLLLISGGTLLMLLIMGLTLLWAVKRGSGDEALEQANESYRSGSWTDAISKYNQYLERFPTHAGTSLARVRRGVAQLRQRTQPGTSDWGGALQATKDVLDQIAPEKEFPDAHADLGIILLTIAESLAAEARAKTDPKLVADSEEAIHVLRRVVPSKLWQAERLGDVEASLAQTQHDIVRGDELEKAVAAIHKAVGAGRADEAYAIRKAALQVYPELLTDAKLMQATLEISQVQQSAVSLVAASVQATTAAAPSPITATVTPARTTLKANVSNVEGRTLFATVDGAAYALDATTGRLLWRQFLGIEPSGQAAPPAPIPLSDAPASDVVLVDHVRNEIVLVEGTTGKLRWRYPVGEPFGGAPAITPDKILVPTLSGKLIFVETASGQSQAYVKLPQALETAPAVDPGRGLVFQPADHHNLFVLSLEGGACQQVLYLGHERGAITTPPVVAGHYLILPVNDLAEDSTLHVLAIGQSTDPNAPLCQPVQQMRLRGHVDTTPLVSGRRVLVATDLGAVYVFDLSSTAPAEPLQKIADRPPAAGDANVIHFPMMEGGQFWLAGADLTKYDVLTSLKRLAPKWTIFERSVFLQSPVAMGEATFQVRRRQGLPGAVVSAVAMTEPNVFWETQIAAPLAGEPIVDAQTVTATTSLGALFRLDGESFKGKTVAGEPAMAVDPAQVHQPFIETIRLEGGLLAISAGKGSKLIPVFDPQLARRFRQLSIPEALACSPIAFDQGVLAPSTVGQIYLMDPRTCEKMAEPFFPPLGGAAQPAWTRPALLGTQQVIAADGVSQVYRLGVKNEPKRHLTVFNKESRTDPIVTPVAVLGNAAFVVDSAGMLTVLALPTLTQAAQQPLTGRVAWGPQTVGNYVFLETDDDQLWCFNSQYQVAWRTPLAYGPLAGPPLAIGENFVLASNRGTLWKVNAAKGNEVGKVDTLLPLATGPVLRGDRLIVGGHDGTLYEVQQP